MSWALVTCILQECHSWQMGITHTLGCFSGADAGVHGFAFVVFTSACLLGV